MQHSERELPAKRSQSVSGIMRRAAERCSLQKKLSCGTGTMPAAPRHRESASSSDECNETCFPCRVRASMHPDGKRRVSTISQLHVTARERLLESSVENGTRVSPSFLVCFAVAAVVHNGPSVASREL